MLRVADPTGRPGTVAPLDGMPCWGRPVGLATAPATEGDLGVYDVVVVGAGLAGTSTALHLAQFRPRLRVALVDARCAAGGSSGRGTGLLGPRFGPPVDVARRRFGDDATCELYTRSERAVHAVLDLAARFAPDAVHACDGQLVTGFTRAEREAVRRRGQAYAELGLDVPLVAAGDHARPAAAGAPALHYRLAAGVDPAALTRGLARAAAALGVQLVDDTAVLDLQPADTGSTWLHTTTGNLRARAVVVTVDATPPGLALPVAGLLDLEVCASASEVLPDRLLAELGGPAGPHVLSAAPLGAYRRISPDGRLVLGGGPAIAWRGSTTAALDRRRAAAWRWQRTWLDRIHPALREVPVTHRWSGRITATADGLPVLGRSSLPGQVWYAGGWNGHGLAATVAAGARIADLVLRDDAHPAGRAHRAHAAFLPECLRPAGNRGSDTSDVLWRPARSWPLAHPALAPALRRVLATQVPCAEATEDPAALTTGLTDTPPTREQGLRMPSITFLRKPFQAIESSLSLPTGRLGTAVGHAMSVQHRSLTRWALRQLDPSPDADVLDVGCGSGMALRLVSEANTSGRLAGVDLSPTMVGLARRTNSAVPQERLDVRDGNAMDLPFPDQSFDVVTAIETFYFWPDANRGLAECRRVLRPGGWLCVTLEMTRDAAEDPTPLQRVFGRRFTDRSDAEGLRILSGSELADLFRAAGLTRVRFAVEPRRSLGWLCVLGQVPPLAAAA